MNNILIDCHYHSILNGIFVTRSY